MLLHAFGPASEWPEQDLIAFSDEFDASITLAAYYSGVFPMPLNESGFAGQMGWWSPVRRGVLDLGDLRVTRSLRKSGRHYTTTVDLAFGEVLRRCADPSRPGGWIDGQVRRVYSELYERGIVHSVETWDGQGHLAGGLYGVSLHGLFAGESMFHDPERGRDASKIALGRLVNELQGRPDGDALLDVQWVTGHLASLGASEISRDDYLARLDAALGAPDTVWSRMRRPGDWRLDQTT